MTPQDAVKLCYQSAFGCGHLVKNAEFAMSMLKNEYDSVDANADAPLFEDIGGGYQRLYLSAAKSKGIELEKICEIFMESANSGTVTEIEPKISVLKNLAKEGKTPFSKDELKEYLDAYNGEMVRHSEKYRKEYTPAYRVVLEKFSAGLQ